MWLVLKNLKGRGEKAALTTVFKVDKGKCGHFKVKLPEYGDPEDAEINDVIVGVDKPKHQLLQ